MSECSLEEITEMWNNGFWHDYSDKPQTPLQRLIRMARFHIDPELSLALYVDGIPAGFILIGWRSVHGRAIAWNGGTGIVPTFRRKGLGKILMQEAIQRVKAAGAHSFSLETRLNNIPAIRLYQGHQFQKLDQLQTFKKNGNFEGCPFPVQKDDGFVTVCGRPEAVGPLPFYCGKLTSWTTQWFNIQEGKSIIVYHPLGGAIGYATYREYFNQTGQLAAVELYHCEVAPTYPQQREVLHHMLSQIYRPEIVQLERKAHYIRASNEELVKTLMDAGFQPQLEEHLMELVF